MSKHHHKSEPAPPPAAVSAPTGVAAAALEERRRHGGVTFEEAVRARAYENWERAGRPDGDGVRFWLDAEAELSPAR